MLATIAITGQVVLRSMIDGLSSDAKIVNVAGRQRMLSQRIAASGLDLSIGLSGGSAATRAAAAADHEAATDLWGARQDWLVDLRLDSKSIGSAHDVLLRFDQLTPHYHAARRVAAALLDLGEAPDGDSALAARLASDLRRHADAFLPIMDSVVNAYEAESNESLERLARWELALLGITLVALVAQAFLIFEPLMRRMMRAISRAEAASRAKGDFLSNMSHELRTPMNSILGYSELLANPEFREDPGQVQEATRAIEVNGRHLLGLINDVLDLSKIEAGKLQVEKIETSPVQIVEDAVSLLRPMAVEKALTLSIEYSGPLPASIRSDPTRLRQIIMNLVNNAIKFTAEGSVRVRVRTDTTTERLVIDVVDTGIGMTEAQREVISRFQAFNQADTTTTRRFGGTGLGLRISNQLAEMLGEGLVVESEPGVGSVFTATIATGALTGVEMINPKAAGVVRAQAPSEHVVSLSAGTPLLGRRVLLAADGPDNQLSFHLRKAGAEVEVVENGRIACERLLPDGGGFDLVLMDMQMPEMDGYTATRHLRQKGLDILVLALTANGMSGDRAKCLDAGCDEYETQPVSRVRLIAACRRLLDGSLDTSSAKSSAA